MPPLVFVHSRTRGALIQDFPKHICFYFLFFTNDSETSKNEGLSSRQGLKIINANLNPHFRTVQSHWKNLEKSWINASPPCSGIGKTRRDNHSFTKSSHFCAKRFFHPVVKKNWYPSSSSASRKIIDFCERYLEGVTGLLDLGSLSLGFWVIRKWIVVNVFNEWCWPVQGPFFDHQICVFYAKTEKMCSSRSALVRHLLASFARTDVFWRCSICGYVLELRTKSVASRPCRARCI